MARKSLMSVDYEQLKLFVKEAMFTGGGINEPSAPQGIPHRMPAADTAGDEQNMGDPKANQMYDIALAAREATEDLVEALDDPIFDSAYEYAFKASAALRKVLNSLEETGAHPMPDQRVVAPPATQQKYAGYLPYAGAIEYGAGTGNPLNALEEAEEELKGFGAGTMSQSAQGLKTKQKGADIGKGAILQGVDNRERKILLQIEDVLTDVADKVDLVRYRPILHTFLTQFLTKIKKDPDLAAAGDKQ